jgi:hypothetical protein
MPHGRCRPDPLDLERLRAQGDPLFDEPVADLVRARGEGALNDALRGYVANEQPIPRDVPPALDGAIREAASSAAWADPGRVERAGAFFARHAVPLAFLLGTTSLLECFAARKGVKALHATGRMLHAGASRRIGETGQSTGAPARSGRAAGRSRTATIRPWTATPRASR